MPNTIRTADTPVLNAFIEKSAKASTTVEQNKTAANTTTSKAAASQDATKLSGTASLLSAAASSSDDVRTDKVAALRAAIYNGTYNVPSSAVADSLIRHLQS